MFRKEGDKDGTAGLGFVLIHRQDLWKVCWFVSRGTQRPARSSCLVMKSSLSDPTTHVCSLDVFSFRLYILIFFAPPSPVFSRTEIQDIKPAVHDGVHIRRTEDIVPSFSEFKFPLMHALHGQVKYDGSNIVRKAVRTNHGRNQGGTSEHSLVKGKVDEAHLTPHENLLRTVHLGFERPALNDEGEMRSQRQLIRIQPHKKP